jgi:hypothetical protein
MGNVDEGMDLPRLLEIKKEKCFKCTPYMK